MKVKLHNSPSSAVDIPTKYPQVAAQKAGRAWFGSGITDARFINQQKLFAVYELLGGRSKTPTGTFVRVEISAQEAKAQVEVGQTKSGW